MNLNPLAVNDDWAGFLGRTPAGPDREAAASAVRGKRVLITGAGGSIGSGLARAVLAAGPAALVLLDLSEAALYQSWRALAAAAQAASAATEIIPVTGSVADSRFLAHLFRQHRPQTLFHAAAYKHVPLMELNPFSALANNAVGTYRLAAASLDAGVARLVSISTDKAVNPRSVMGASKRISELVVLSHASAQTRMCAVRLCNVLGSSGSVAVVFEEQAQKGLPLPVTDRQAERYFLAPVEAENAILRAAASAVSGGILIPDCGEAIRIVDLARYIQGRWKSGSRIEIVGTRPGDKLREELMAAGEVVQSHLSGGMRVVASPHPTSEDLADSMQRLIAALDRFDSSELRTVLAELVPNFECSRTDSSPATAFTKDGAASVLMEDR